MIDEAFPGGQPLPFAIDGQFNRSESWPKIGVRRSSATSPCSSTLPKVLAIWIRVSFKSRKILPSMVSDRTSSPDRLAGHFAVRNAGPMLVGNTRFLKSFLGVDLDGGALPLAVGGPAV